MASRIVLCAALALAGCGDSGNNTDGGGFDAGPGGCSAMGKDVPAYTGDSAGALAMTRPIVLSFAPDATLATISGSGINLNGQSTGASGTWIVTFYSPSLKHNFIGALSGSSAHVGCQDVKIPNPPAPEPNPTLTSQDAMQTAVDRILAAYPMAKLPGQAQDLTYGYVAAGSHAPFDRGWRLTMPPLIVVVDDQTNTAIFCQNSGTDCP